MSRPKDDRQIDRRLNGWISLQGVGGAVAERLANARQERTEKVAFAQKLTATPKRRK